MADTNFDLIVVGGGPGGYVAAIRAAQLKMKVCVVEKQHLGGICLNWGCIPTKALLRSAEIYHYMQHADAYGLSAEKVGFDAGKVVQRSRAVSKQLNSGVGHLLKKNKVTVVDGAAKLNGPGKLTVTKDGKNIGDLTAPHIILATGARPRALPGIEPDKKLIWTYFEAMVPEKMPKTLLVIGSGAIGIEFASFYHTMGVDVTVVEVMPQILPVEDEEIAKHAHKRFEKMGMKIMTEAKVTGVKKGSDNVTATIEDKAGKKSEITVDRIISAVGVQGNIEDIGLDTTKVKTDRGCIVIDEYGRTAEKGIYAIGDVAGPPMLAHKAEHEGVICVEKIAGLNDVHPMKKEQIPGCTYCHPQVASVGLTEKKAKEAGYEVKVGRFPFIGNGKAIALGEPEGLVKTVFDAKTGQLLGAHMVGAEVTELIQGYVVAMGLETTEAELMHTVFPHPTLSEMMHESVLDAYGRVIHM
ncbi:dihydrolipoyl dehydrogenase [Pelagibius sp. 7325]|uniref:dihydrolipoyl dehydrogenase n=1 Tax=Pelagibius sp. 7325 TaxID=3131994 RepID=UPI0030ECD314